MSGAGVCATSLVSLSYLVTVFAVNKRRLYIEVWNGKLSLYSDSPLVVVHNLAAFSEQEDWRMTRGAAGVQLAV